MGERGMEARQTQGTEEHMQRVLLVSFLLARRVKEESGLSSTMDSVSEDRGSREEEGKMASTWLVVTSGDSGSEWS